MSRILLGPINRVEGDLDISLELDGSVIREARVNSTLYRGFEQLLVGKPALDALVYAPRICGICSVSQSQASALALAEALQLEAPANGELCRNLMLANESLADLLTHFYLFFMPDFARADYSSASWYPQIARRFQAIKGEAAKTVLPARAQFLHILGLLGGKWPHTLSLQPGGSSKPVRPQERLQLLTLLRSFRNFLEKETFAAPLERINALSSPQELAAWEAEESWQTGDLRTFLHLSRELRLDQLGRGYDHFLSYGNFSLQGQKLLPAGTWNLQEGYQPLDTNAIAEDVSHAWLEEEPARHPRQGSTRPVVEKDEAYSWCKAPRLDGQVMETGALARALVAGQPLLTALVREQGGSVHTRVLARLLELARLLPEMEHWAAALQPEQPFAVHAEEMGSGEGAGLMEAARGSLGHWLRLEKGRITHYQIVAPTTWNFSPRDSQQQPGALEKALAGTQVEDPGRDSVRVQHILRSFDPCMVCTVH
ncbi:nickel-dependent hydrogenase large subunit [Marinospirillum perlucidum]|uniref:nickel-dependent hydrogenase large subunit n=1 Tax=Marinospirillum perlucidum TaxID=1982602 RepID=UPI000DF1F58B|nr:nickel-dependent hydrogenase large subunit [Marinospirillum perlucidum]